MPNQYGCTLYGHLFVGSVLRAGLVSQSVELLFTSHQKYPLSLMKNAKMDSQSDHIDGIHASGGFTTEHYTQMQATNGDIETIHTNNPKVQTTATRATEKSTFCVVCSLFCLVWGGSTENKNDENEEWPMFIEWKCTPRRLLTADWKTLKMDSQRLLTWYS